MKKLIESEVNAQNPWEDDKLGRGEVAKRISKLLETTKGPLVVSVSASYGMGKTFFSKRWCADLEQQGKISIYFNAWETDFADNPLLPLIHAITEKVESLGFSSREQKKISEKVKDTIKSAAPVMLRSTMKIGIRALTFGVTDGKVDDVWDAMATGALDEVEKFASTQLDAFSFEKKARASFKNQLTELQSTILDAKQHNKDKKPINDDDKIYIFIDELDRCRPPYALEFLEAIKHLFDVPGFVFILCVDELALQASAAQIYGMPESGEGYLRKFIDYRFRLPEPENKEAMAEHLFDTYKLIDVIPESRNNSHWGKEATIDSFAFWARQLNMSLRSQSQAFALIDMVVRTYGPNIIEILTALCCLREARPKIWEQLIKTDTKFGAAIEALGFDPHANRSEDQDKTYYNGLLRLFFSQSSLPPQINEKDHGSVDHMATQIRDHLRTRISLDDSDRLDYIRNLIKKIELIADMRS